MQYATIEREYVVTTEVCKSKFICRLAPIETLDEGLEYVARIKKEFSDARHNCYAIIGTPESNSLKYRDDGEPSGTAGIPMMGALQKNGLYGVVCVVTRYFGGIKLGTGGLVRAYTKGAKIALEAAGIITKVLYQTVIVSVDYTMLGNLQNLLKIHNYDTKDIVYEDIVHLHIWVEIEDTAHFKDLIVEWTNGRAIITDGEIDYKII